MERFKKVAIDNDDVLANFNTQLCRFHNQNYGTTLKLKDIKTYNLWEVWKCGRQEAIRRVDEFYHSEYFHKIEPMKGSTESIGLLYQKSDLVVVTSRPFVYQQLTYEWLDRHFPNKFVRVYHTNHFSPDESKSKNKSDVCIELGIDLIIEDGPFHTIDCAAKGVNVLLFNRPWNPRFQFPEGKLPIGIKRVYSWGQIVKELTE